VRYGDRGRGRRARGGGHRGGIAELDPGVPDAPDDPDVPDDGSHGHDGESLGHDGEFDELASECESSQGKRADGGDQTLMNDGKDKKTFEDIDGLEWIVAKGTSTDKDETIGSDDVKHYFIIQEDGGNRFGERMFIARRPSGTAKADYHFVAQAGGAKNSRMLAGVSVPPRTFASAKASEFSGVADLSGVLTQATVGGAARREAERKIDINDKTILIGLQQHSISAGVVSTFGQDRGGQVLAWDVDHVPN